jgi:O-acetyl-ADP-ribose deacetylase (regulator of RNase III)
VSGLPTKSTRIEMVRGDITSETTDAIVNAANSSLLGGGGVDGAIHSAGGPAILAECRSIRETHGPLDPGESVITSAGLLPCRYVIHTVGPMWQGGGQGEPETLASCYRTSLALAVRHGLGSVAFPSISTGVFGYPVAQAAAVAVGAVLDFLDEGPPLVLVRWVLFSDRDLEAYRAALGKRAG